MTVIGPMGWLPTLSFPCLVVLKRWWSVFSCFGVVFFFGRVGSGWKVGGGLDSGLVASVVNEAEEKCEEIYELMRVQTLAVDCRLSFIGVLDRGAGGGGGLQAPSPVSSELKERDIDCM